MLLRAHRSFHSLHFIAQTPEDLRGAVRPYSLTDHIHEREASYRLGSLLHGDRSSPFSLSFIPTVAPWFSGIISVANIPLKQTMRADDIWKIYEEKYAGEPLVSINRKGVPDVKDAEGRHGWRMGGLQVHSSGKRVVVVGTLDNLLKGAATQCMQNLNLALGYDELAGVPKDLI
jgi:N-acetyl-gamma-glutamyl-phosphate reductase/acetylglutamate kinase